jgi:hypothetical protein
MPHQVSICVIARQRVQCADDSAVLASAKADFEDVAAHGHCRAWSRCAQTLTSEQLLMQSKCCDGSESHFHITCPAMRRLFSRRCKACQACVWDCQQSVPLVTSCSPFCRALFELLRSVPDDVLRSTRRIAFDGTSATALLVDRSTGAVVADAKLYNEAQAQHIVDAATVRSRASCTMCLLLSGCQAVTRRAGSACRQHRRGAFRPSFGPLAARNCPHQATRGHMAPNPVAAST